MMVVVPAFAGGEPGNKAKVRGRVIEVPMAEGVIGAVDDCIQENVQACLYEESAESPNRAQKQHEDGDTNQNSSDAEAEKMAVEPVITNVRRECLERLWIFGFAIVVVNVAQQNAPEAFEYRAVRIALDVGVAVMLAMHRHPLLGINSGPQPKLHAHGECSYGMQIHTTVRQSPMQVNAGRECGKLHNYNYSYDCVQEMYQETPARCAF
jgi:hypothetical protein